MQLYHFPFNAMGSRCEVQLYASNKSVAEHVANLVIQDVKRIEQRYSRYNENSVLSDINRVAEQGGTISIDDETRALLDYADTCYQQSDGLFDITSGILREVWDFKSQKIPSEQAIKSLLPRIGWEKLIISEAAIQFTRPGMQLDFGGIGKEYAVDRAAAICQANGIQHGVVDLGGDIKIIGAHADGRPWSVGIRHPRRPGQLMGSIAVYQGAVASSGDYERNIILRGKRYSHILNPKTGWPVRGLASITVLADQCVVAGSLATMTLLKEKQGKRWIKDLGVSCLWMDDKQRTGGSLSVK